MSEEQTENTKPALKRIITVMDNYRMRRTAPNPKGGEREASLALTFVGDNPRFNLNTNVESDPRQGYLPARINVCTLVRLMHTILAVAEGKMEDGATIKNKHNYDADSNYHETPVHVSTFVIGKEEDGRIYISLIAQNYTPVKFHFVSDPYHIVCNRKGEPLPDSSVSKMVAQDYANLILSCLPMALHEVAMAKGVATDAPVSAQEGSDDPSVEQSSRNEGGGNNYGGGGKRYNNGGKYQNRNNNGGGGYNRNNNYNGGGGKRYNNGGGGYQKNNGGYNRNNNNGYQKNNGGGGSYSRDSNTDFDTSVDIADDIDVSF